MSGGRRTDRVHHRWVYESILGAVPGIEFSRVSALAVQIALFEAGVLGLAGVYGRWESVPAGTATVLVAAAGSGFLLTLGRRIRALAVPRWYSETLFGTGIEIVLSLVTFIGLLTYLFVVDPSSAETSLLETVLGDPLPAPAVFFTLLVIWDVCYRIGTGWWTSIVGLWRTIRLSSGLDRETAVEFQRIDAITIGFALVQLSLVPFVLEKSALVVALTGHVLAVTVVSGMSIVVLRMRLER